MDRLYHSEEGVSKFLMHPLFRMIELHGFTLTKGLPCWFLFLNVFVKPDEQSQACLSSAMARKGERKPTIL